MSFAFYYKIIIFLYNLSSQTNILILELLSYCVVKVKMGFLVLGQTLKLWSIAATQFWGNRYIVGFGWGH